MGGVMGTAEIPQIRGIVGIANRYIFTEVDPCNDSKTSSPIVTGNPFFEGSPGLRTNPKKRFIQQEHAQVVSKSRPLGML